MRASSARFPACADFASAWPIAGWDGVGETWFDTIADADRAFATEPYAGMLALDRPKFIGSAHSCYIEELPVIPPAGGKKTE
jgi:hypothetical protein